MNMNKKSKLLFLILSSLAVCACSNPTIEEERTIILNIDSDVTPVFTSNYGDGSYDQESGKYTHKINSIKDIYITLSYENLKTLTVYIPTSEMTNKTITKTVDFGAKLDAEVEVTIEGIKSLEGIEFKPNPNISNLKLGKKNTFKFNLPSRENNELIQFSIPGYKDFEINIDKESLTNGMAHISTAAVNVNQIYISINGTELSYQVYSMSTNEMVASGSKSSYEDDKTDYILLPNDDAYYMNVTYHYHGVSNLYKINQNENFILEGKNIKTNYGMIYLTENGNNDWRTFYIYDKVNKIITSSNVMTNKLSSLAIILRDDQDKWVYIDNLTTTHRDNDNYYHYYEIDYSSSVPVEFNVTRKHTFTNEIISTGIEDDYYINDRSITSIELQGSTFNVTSYENEEAELIIDLYDKDENVIHTLTHNIYETFETTILNGTINYQGKKIPYKIPIFKDDIVYNNGSYTYIGKPIIDTNISLIEIIYFNENMYKDGLSDSAYITTTDGLPILKTDIGDGKIYFELVANIPYTLHNNTQSYEFTLSNQDMENGEIIIWDESIKYAQVKIPNEYYIKIENDINLYPDDNNIVRVPVSNDKSNNNICLSNGIATICINKQLSENQYIELNPFYTFDVESYFIEGNQNFEVYNTTGENLKSYYYLDFSGSESIIETNIYTNTGRNITFTLEDFEYDEELKGYYYSFEDNVTYITNYHYLMDYSQTEFFQINQYIYILNGNVLTLNDIEYDLSTYGSKKLNISIIYNGYEDIIEITPEN